MYCVACGKKITSLRGRTGNPKYPTCRGLECQKIANKMREKEYKMLAKRKRQEGIKRLKNELATKEEFIRAVYESGGSEKLARMYGIPLSNVKAHREKLFDGMAQTEIRALENQIASEVFKDAEKPKTEVKVYKIVDMEAFEKGGPGTYNGLKFDRIEYAKDIIIPFNLPLVEEVEEQLNKTYKKL